MMTPLHMGGTSIMDRLSRVVKSNVNKWVSNIENPEKVINQSVNDLQVRLVVFLQIMSSNQTSPHVVVSILSFWKFIITE